MLFPTVFLLLPQHLLLSSVGLKLAITICETEETNNCTEAFSSESNLNLHTAKITEATMLHIIYIILLIKIFVFIIYKKY